MVPWTNIKLSKLICIKLERFLGTLLGPLLKTGLPLMKNLLRPLAKSVLVPLGLTPTASATDAAMRQRKFLDLV